MSDQRQPKPSDKSLRIREYLLKNVKQKGRVKLSDLAKDFAHDNEPGVDWTNYHAKLRVVNKVRYNLQQMSDVKLTISTEDKGGWGETIVEVIR